MIKCTSSVQGNITLWPTCVGALWGWKVRSSEKLIGSPNQLLSMNDVVANKCICWFLSVLGPRTQVPPSSLLSPRQTLRCSLCYEHPPREKVLQFIYPVDLKQMVQPPSIPRLLWHVLAAGKVYTSAGIQIRKVPVRWFKWPPPLPMPHLLLP